MWMQNAQAIILSQTVLRNSHIYSIAVKVRIFRWHIGLNLHYNIIFYRYKAWGVCLCFYNSRTMSATAKPKTSLESARLRIGSERNCVSKWSLLTVLTEIHIFQPFDLKCCMCVLICLWNVMAGVWHRYSFVNVWNSCVNGSF